MTAASSTKAASAGDPARNRDSGMPEQPPPPPPPAPKKPGSVPPKPPVKGKAGGSKATAPSKPAPPKAVPPKAVPPKAGPPKARAPKAQSTAQPTPNKRKEAVQLSQTLTIAKRIGRGRLGVVYAAVHSVLARRFAVKVLRPSLTRAENTQSRLRHMIRDASQVEHPAICSLVDFGQLPDKRFYITMDFVRGIQLSQVLERDGKVDAERAIPLLIQLADALGAAHRLRVVHGDLKPTNVMLVDDTGDQPESLRILDFRLSSALAGPPQDDDPMVHLAGYGGVDYLAPEQIAGRSWDGRADTYAFGCLAYRMLTGQPPFVGDPSEVMQAHKSRDPVPPSRRSGVQGIPADLDAVVLRCLEKKPTDRFKTMEEISWELSALVSAPAEQSPFEEEVTGRWQIEFDAEEGTEEPLPESPARLRRLFYDTILELSEHIVEEDVAGLELQQELTALKQVREEASQLAAQVELAENRFEDIRRELRERESTLRYAIIDLNLAKSDTVEGKRKGRALSDLEFQITELEASLAELERQRRERFAALNAELKQTRDRLKQMEHEMAVHYRRLYAELDEARSAVITQESRNLYRRLERCRAALAQSQPE
jgi:serine/threonine protein kinase